MFGIGLFRMCHLTHMRSWFTLRKCVSDFLSGIKKWNQLRASARIVVSQIIQDKFILEIISSYIHRLETWWIIKHYQRHYTKPRNVVLRTRLSYCFLLSIKHRMHWFEELGFISVITSNPHSLKFISIEIGFQGTTSFFSLHVHI